LPNVTRDGVAHLCARSDAPAWIIAPVWNGTIIPPELKPLYWHPVQPIFRMTDEGDSYAWHRVLSYAVLPCASTDVRPRS